MTERVEGVLTRVSERFGSALERGIAPWQVSTGNSAAYIPKNAYTGEAYGGLNAILLGSEGGKSWATGFQIQQKWVGAEVGGGPVEVIRKKEINVPGTNLDVTCLEEYSLYPVKDKGRRFGSLPEFDPVERVLDVVSAARESVGLPQRDLADKNLEDLYAELRDTVSAKEGWGKSPADAMKADIATWHMAARCGIPIPEGAAMAARERGPSCAAEVFSDRHLAIKVSREAERAGLRMIADGMRRREVLDNNPQETRKALESMAAGLDKGRGRSI